MNNNPFDQLEKNLTTIFRKELGEFRQMFPKSIIEPPKDRQGGKKLAMEVTGLSESSIYKFSMKNAIPCTRRGNRLWFSEQQLKEWCEMGMPHWGELQAKKRINEHLKK